MMKYSRIVAIPTNKNYILLGDSSARPMPRGYPVYTSVTTSVLAPIGHKLLFKY